MQKRICVALYLVLFLLSTGCGTFWYPERKGQKSGQVDSKVVFMNSAMYLFFIIPGVIGFMVDMDNGCIYLPGGYYGENKEEENQKMAEVAKKAKLEFTTDATKEAQPIYLNLKSGSLQLENAKELREAMQKSSCVHLYYEGQRIQTQSINSLDLRNVAQN